MPPPSAALTTSASAPTVQPRSSLCKLIRAFFPRCSRTLMLFFTGAAHHSWDILADQEEATRLPAGPAVEALHQVKNTAALMKEALLCGDLERFGHLLDDAWQAKKRVSHRISSPRIDGLYQAAREQGALGGKITGAGGGGFLLLYCEPTCH
jgi:D-glycero-alpha-D-manno-heptose-7-phosphate kinase